MLEIQNKRVHFIIVYFKIVYLQVNSIFNCHNPKAHEFYYKIIILFPDLFISSLSLSDFRYHRYKHNFQDSLNLLGNCGLNTESTSCYLLLLLLLLLSLLLSLLFFTKKLVFRSHIYNIKL